MTKKPTIAARPLSQAAENFLAGAAQNVETASPKKDTSGNKKQVPLLIPPALLAELDAILSEDEFGGSRSMWICKAIREKINREKPGSAEQ